MTVPGADRLGPPIDVRPLFRPRRQALVSLLRELSGPEWAGATICPGWSVKDIAAHVLGDDLGRLARTRDGYSGGGHRDGETIAVFIDRLNSEWVTAARRLSPALLTDLLVTAGEQVADLWQQAEPDVLGEAVSWAGPQPAPVWLDAARDFTEYWTHEQQIRDATGRPGPPEPAVAYTVLDTFMRALPYTLRETPAPDGTQVEVTVPDLPGASWTATRDGAGWSVRRGAGEPPDAQVTLAADTAWRLCTAGISEDRARELAALGGERRLGEAVLRIISIIHL
jgi:uncharacterized protein (TIGR03083 family)